MLENDKRADGDDLTRATILSVGTPKNGSIKVLSQVDEIDFADIDVNDVEKIKISLNGFSIDLNFSDKDTLAQELSALINDSPEFSEFVTASHSEQKIIISAIKPGDGQDISASTINSAGQSSSLFVNSIVANGSLIYTPSSNFNGSDSFIYTITNNFEVESFSSATVSINVTAENDAPEAAKDFKTTADDDEVVSVNFVANDIDIDGDELSVLKINNIKVSDVDSINLASGAKIQIIKSDVGNVEEFKFDPSGAFNSLSVGQEVVESFSYTVSDGSVGLDDTQNIEVTSISTAESGKQLNKVLLSGEIEKGDKFFIKIDDIEVSYQAIDGDQNSNVAKALIDSLNAQGDLKQIILAKTGDSSAEIVIEGKINGKSLDVVARANNAGTDTQSVEITVTGSNDAPVAQEANFSVNEDEVLIGDLNASDPDEGDVLSIDLAAGGAPQFGIVEIKPPDENHSNYRFEYEPDGNFFGSYSFVFRVEDSQGPQVRRPSL